MADKTTFIKLDRNIKRWGWYKDANTMRVFVDLLIEANISDNVFMGVTVHRGEIASSYASIANSLNLTIQNVRTAILHLKSTGELTVQRHRDFSVFSIVNYDYYQSKLTDQLTVCQQSANSQLTVSSQQLKNLKNLKKEKNIGGGDSTLDEWTPPAKGTPEYEAWRNQ